MSKKDKVSAESYKGVRDFYPEDQSLQEYIFSVWRKVCQNYGYEQYNASILESTELYTAKSSEEIVNEQTYTFTDRGDRSVTLRPEMTPSVARLIAKKRRELTSPIRWFSIENFFRYERPQRGRLREFWQLNADIFGVPGVAAEVEIISLAYDIMREFGATENDFEIRINNRGTLKAVLVEGGMSDEDAEKELAKMDKGGSKIKIDPDKVGAHSKEIINALKEKGIRNARFDEALVRGFSYYTGTVFEIFDTHKDNNQSLFGGGRYDNILEIFGEEKVPAVGFGMGDVGIKNFLESRDLLPKYRPATDLYICTLSTEYINDAVRIADKLRQANVNVAVNLLDKKVADQLKIAHKKEIPFVIVVGEKELKDGLFNLKKMDTGEEQTALLEEIPGHILRA